MNECVSIEKPTQVMNLIWGWAAQSPSQEVPMTPFTSTFIASNNYHTILSQLGKIIPCICSVASSHSGWASLMCGTYPL